MTVRAATEADLPRVLDMGARFYATTPYAAFAAFDRASAEQLGRFLLASGVLLVAETDGDLSGMVGLHVGPSMFNAACITAHEVMWWVEPEARHGGAGIALLRAIEAACKEKGARAIQMMHLADSPPQAGMIYRRLGYAHTETSYFKEI